MTTEYDGCAAPEKFIKEQLGDDAIAGGDESDEPARRSTDRPVWERQAEEAGLDG